ncbi:SDR family NAD(P)-dependent oxidoreductase [Nocardia sp. NPDC052001]|uniref:SDR family NAD(P)-dependent oxidoreductase n=1 Tax=Nocardia sp. NPDC052001 TaxID=3154853 RepID=UPI00343F4CA8
MRALVTGGTEGIGREIAIGLVGSGAQVLVTGRDAARGAAFAAQTGATFLTAEHATVHGNLELAAAVARTTGELDILVNNVGGMAFPNRTLNSEGHEVISALNYLGPITLTDALLPILTPNARIVQIVSSALLMHKGDPFTEPDTYTAIGAYARAKQLNLLAMLSLARQAADDRSINAVNPGTAWTPGVRQLTPETVPAWRFIWPIVRAVQKRARPDRAARVPLRLALESVGSGQFFESKGKPASLPERLRAPNLQDRAWEAALVH